MADQPREHSSVGIIFGAGLLYWGNRFKSFRRTTIILYGILGGAVLVGAGLVINHSAGLAPVARPVGRRSSPPFGLFVLAGATPAALGLLADISERFPPTAARSWASTRSSSRSARSSARSSAASAADSAASTAMLVATFGLLLVALIPLAQLRRDEHYVTGHRGRCGVRRRGELSERSAASGSWRPLNVAILRSAGGRLRSHDAATGPFLTTAEAR